jgi:hypothetical protein
VSFWSKRTGKLAENDANRLEPGVRPPVGKHYVCASPSAAQAPRAKRDIQMRRGYTGCRMRSN